MSKMKSRNNQHTKYLPGGHSQPTLYSAKYAPKRQKYDSKRTTELELEMIGKSDIDLS